MPVLGFRPVGWLALAGNAYPPPPWPRFLFEKKNKSLFKIKYNKVWWAKEQISCFHNFLNVHSVGWLALAGNATPPAVTQMFFWSKNSRCSNFENNLRSEAEHLFRFLYPFWVSAQSVGLPLLAMPTPCHDPDFHLKTKSRSLFKMKSNNLWWAK